jgi:acyl-CoA thioester hydrolase
MDAYGHVNNTAYLAYLEQARVAMFFDQPEAQFDSATVVVHHEITYLRPVVYHPEPLRLELWVEKIGGASFKICYDVFDGEVLAARANTTMCAFDFTADIPRRLSDNEREMLSRYFDAPASA